MKIIHIAATDEAPRQHPENLARTLWEQGKIPHDALYWTEGMDEWRPASEFFAQPLPVNPYAPPEIREPAAPTASASIPGGTLPSTRLNRWLITMLILSIASDCAALVGDVLQWQLLQGSFTEAAGTSNDHRQQILGMVQVLVFFGTTIPFGMWIHRANRVCRSLGAHRLTFSPGWSVGYYFIPILNLFKPYQAMKEIWQASHDPQRWPQHPGSPVLGMWWSAWLISNVLGQLSARVAVAANDVASLETATGISILDNVFNTLLSFAALQLVRKIAHAQQQRVAESYHTA